MKKQQEIRNWLETYEASILTEAERLKKEQFPELTEELFSQFERTGNRLAYEHAYFGRRKYLLVYVLEILILKKRNKTANMNKLEWVLQQITEERCWALPAHVNRRTDPAWEITLDLFASETAQTLSEIGWIFWKELEPDLREKMEKEVYRRVLAPFGKSEKGSYGWERDCNNWNAVCGGCVGAAAWYRKQMCKEKTQRQEMEDIIERICDDLPCFLKSFSADGACMEGLGYWEYGMSYYTMLADLLRQSGEKERSLLSGEKIRKIMEFQQLCYFPGGCTLSFSDGDSRGKYRMGLTCYLAGQEKNVEIPEVKNAMQFGQDPCYRWNAGYRDWLWTGEWLDREIVDNTEPAGEKDEENRWKSCILPDAQWAIFHGNHQISAACKGGHNGEPHNHNDVGSFLYVIGEEEIVSDLGAGEYTKEYFGKERYEILCNSSRGHNVPVVNGEYQQAGESYNAEQFQILDPWTIEISYGSAYQEEFSGRLKRKVHFIPESGTLQVEDCLRKNGQEKTDMVETLVTRQQVKVEKEGIQIGKNGWVRLSDMESEEVWTESVEHREHDGRKVRVTLVHWPAKRKAGGNYNSRFEITGKFSFPG